MSNRELIDDLRRIGKEDGAYIEMLAAADALEAHEWRDIDSAPKDGTWIRGYFPDWASAEARQGHYQPGQMDTYWTGDCASDKYGRWQTPGRSSTDPYNPTHWKPLDPPPE